MIGGDHHDEASGEVDLAETFTVRTDQGAVFSVHGWLVDVVVLEKIGAGGVNEESSDSTRCIAGVGEVEGARAWDVCCLLQALAAG